MLRIPHTDARAVALVAAIQRGDAAFLAAQLRDTPALASARIVDERGVARTLLHVVADWPGHTPNAAAMVTLLADAGADLNAPLIHRDPSGAPETALHAAASADDVAMIDALLDEGADIEAPGAIFTGGTAMSDAVVFAQWRAARRLLERGATTTISQAAALGLLDRVRALAAAEPTPTADQITASFWHACRAGQRATAEFLLERGAELNWIGFDRKTPLDAAYDNAPNELVDWLIALGARRASSYPREHPMR